MTEFGPGKPLLPEPITAADIRTMLNPFRTPRRWEYPVCCFSLNAARAATVAKRSLNAELRWSER
jgi:hypothetical protein